MKINGKPVRNAKRKLVVHIEAADISRALKVRGARNPEKCAAAQALIREEECTRAKVHLERVYLEKDDHWLRFRTPGSLRTEIIAIDRGGRFEPGEHELKLLHPKEMADTESGRRQGGKDRPGRVKSKIPTRTNHIVGGVREKAIFHRREDKRK